MGEDGEDETPIHRQYDWSTTTPSTTIIDVIAALEDVDAVALPRALETTLFDHVDPEALDTLLATSGSIEISFAFDGYTVRIDESALVVSDS